MSKLKYLLLLLLFGWIHDVHSQTVALTIESDEFFVEQGTFLTIENISLIPSQSLVLSNTSFSVLNSPILALTGSVSKTYSFLPAIESFSGKIHTLYDVPPLIILEKNLSLYINDGVEWKNFQNFSIDTEQNIIVTSVNGVKLNHLNLANIDETPAQIISSTINLENSLITLQFSEGVYSNNNGSGALEVTDFVYSISGGPATLSNTTPTSITTGTASNSYILGLSLLGSPDGTQVITIKPSSDIAVFDFIGNASLAANVSSTVTLNNQLPTITQTSVNSDNTVLTITFSEFMTNAAIAANYTFSLSGGVGTLSSTTPSQAVPTVIGVGNVYSLTFSMSTPPNGSEILTVTTNNNIVDDSIGAVDFTKTQSNTIQLNDQAGPLIASISVDGNNRFVDITFNEAVYGNTPGTTPIIASSLENIISQTQGNNLDLNISSLTSTSGNALVGGETIIRATLNLGGIIPSGNEAYVITATATSTIYDLKGNRIQTQVSNNTFKLVEPDADGDGVNNSIDNCPTTANADQADADADGVGDVCDNAPNTPNANQLDTDGDGLGDVIDTDDDNDSVPDTNDAFPLDASESSDTDGDGVGDSADPDLDNDGVLNTVDNCLYSPNADQLDTDGDGTGNACDTDDDGDGFSDADEIACGSDPLNEASKPLDTDNDGIANCIDPDDDNDSYLDESDAFPLDATEWLDTDADGIGNNADTDDDGDGQLDLDEIACGSDPLLASSLSLDTDGDTIPDCVDTDDDNDGVEDTSDAFPLDPAEWTDIDVDGIGNNADADDDGDGQLDVDELACGSDPLLSSSMSLDTDSDGIPNCVDTDDDGDGVLDTEDVFQLDPAEWTDTDLDGIGNNADEDDDNDGFSDADEIACDSDSLDATSTPLDTDGDSTPDCVDTDDDNDGYLDESDAFPLDATEWLDTDADGIGNNADTDDDGDGQLDTDEIACGSDPLDLNSFSGDIDEDGITDCEDLDNDNDGVVDSSDAFPLDPLEWTDTDADGIGNNADTDDDGDGFSDLDELECNTDPLDKTVLPGDLDGDGIADCKDTDIDGDGCINTQDVFPTNSNECFDTDGDGLGDNFEVDDDNDGYLDTNDAFPLDPNEWADADNDGIGDNADLDDNNDGFEDEKLFISGVLTPNSGGLESTWKIINIERYPNARIRVYNKNGQEVFSAINYRNDWRGTHKTNGSPLPASSYYYIIAPINGGDTSDGWLYITY